MESAIRKGRQLPKWYLDEPPEQLLDGFYLGSFWDLNTERKYELGTIPWGKIIDYGHHVSIDDDILDAFVAIIRHMDAGYIKWAVDETERVRKQRQTTKPGKK